jgi:hypothetical protein
VPAAGQRNHGPRPELASLLTLLPLLRVTSSVLLLVMLVLSFALGARLEITAAWLAGAGVVRHRARFRRAGLGTRRDRGIFYLAEDAFPHRRVHRERQNT